MNRLVGLEVETYCSVRPKFQTSTARLDVICLLSVSRKTARRFVPDLELSLKPFTKSSCADHDDVFGLYRSLKVSSDLNNQVEMTDLMQYSVGASLRAVVL